ncbi:uncharacterized protein LOC127859047 [Dreissena polymorpha]|uniref:uncharacterized protein LOC127859047 n=1 Tax=Dreissena polymorpha TaxID=45954 RepID=UPI002263C51D|nr:uncharacterized protein LOC127859047 [Dreissena polymorpha]
MEARKECWLSESKVKKYKLITAVQTFALRHKLNDLKEMQKVLVKKEKDHMKACDRFKKMHLVEIKMRETVHKIREATGPNIGRDYHWHPSPYEGLQAACQR